MTKSPILLSLLAFTAGLPLVQAADSKGATSAHIDDPAQQSGFIFSLLPRSMESNPHTDLTIICEMTEEGKKRPVVDKEHPASYLLYDVGYQELGDDAGSRQIDKDKVHKQLERALKVNGFHQGDASKPNDIVLMAHWGVNALNYSGETLGSILSRAIMVGGEKFAKELQGVLEQQSKLWEMSNVAGTDADGNMGVQRGSMDVGIDQMKRATVPQAEAASIGTDADGNSLAVSGSTTMDTVGDLLQSMTPLERFKRRDARTQFMVEQTLRGIYFVVISAFDYQAMTQKKRVLLWRARMTVDATGLSLADSIPSMISYSGQYFGRDMNVPTTMTPRLLRGEGKVSIGESQVVEEGVPATDDKKSETQKNSKK